LARRCSTTELHPQKWVQIITWAWPSARFFPQIDCKLEPKMPIFLNLNWLFSASHRQMKTMKSLLFGSAISCALALAIYAQTPAPTPDTPTASPAPKPAPSPALMPTASPSAPRAPSLQATASPADQLAGNLKERAY